ncbi:ribonucleoside-diphosphate reductase large subunit [Caulobacter phage CcrBL9]|uniref:Ribonucleoside-diphosphate reductase n=1 Tax=Caulobacter phage CcrBL9 TaxID=2283270 RepID=A0A385EBG3_9CAUD|nr:ribonucleoside-diphosphate reductase large subunit [Caulobacter phage CcrBL9]AXQ69231.1 ribonucleotide reductase of class Ia (aerobic), alpha subunit [Caulobacter phage CcrBL9]
MDDFSKQTLKERYLLPHETSPQEAYARASAAFADDAEHAQRLYDYASKGWLSFATPVLSNGGSERGQAISCFLTSVEDSRQGIFDHWDEIGWLSSVGGGVGANWSELRGNGEKTSRGSQSTGIIPFIAVTDRIILSVSQGGTRRGSLAVYLDVDHPEIEEFIVGRKPTGGDQNRKFTNLHNAVNITDAFMHHVISGAPFPLRSPKTGEIIRTVNPRELWKLILETRMQTGEPYLHFIDTTNRHLPETQKAKGLKVRQSNLCVTPDTEVLTNTGYLPIEALAGGKHKVWNGEAFSEVEVVQTALSAELVRVWFSDGSYLDCTPYHKFYDEDGVEHRAGELANGLVLEATRHPVIEGGVVVSDEKAYAAGWATVAGFEDDNRTAVFVPGKPRPEQARRLVVHSLDSTVSEDGLLVRFEPLAVPAGVVPAHWSRRAREMWLGAALDAIGEWVDTEHGPMLGFVSPDPDLVKEVRLLAKTLGLNPIIRLTDAGNAFLLPAGDGNSLITRGYVCMHEHADIVTTAQYIEPTVSVVDVHALPYQTATYCFTEPQRNRGTFNGVLTGNCTEITLPTGRDDQGKMRTAVCCLSSLNAEKYREWRHHPTFIEDVFRFLDNCLQVFIEDETPGLENARYSASMERSVGAGLLGFHYLLQSENIAFASEDARALNQEIFAHYSAEATKASLKLGAERGEAPDMIGTGHRFAHRMAVAPNASTSILLNTSPSIEPVRANVFLHKTLSGSFRVRNPYLQKLLETIAIEKAPETEGNTDEDRAAWVEAQWKLINADEGSVQGLDYLSEHEKAVFATAMEIDQEWVITHAADRQPYIDQAQSVNLFMKAGTNAVDLMKVHYQAWAKGLKSLYYLRSTTAKRGENVNSKVERKDMSEHNQVLDVEKGPASPIEDSACLSCEG